MSLLKEISITELSNLRIGHTSDHDAKTGVTVLYFPKWSKSRLRYKRRRPCFQRNSSHLSCTADNPIKLLSCPEVLLMDWLLLTV